MPAISNAAIFTVTCYQLREEIEGALKALSESISYKYQDRREVLSLMQTDDPMMDQAAEESDDIRAIEQAIAELREEEGEMARLLQMVKMHTSDRIEVSHEMLDAVLKRANEVREVEAVAA